MRGRGPGTGNRGPGGATTRRSPDAAVSVPDPQSPSRSLPSSVPGPRSPVPGWGGGGCLFVVATPIGTLGDLSPRAMEVLSAVDTILAEDTRHVRKLLNHFTINTPTRALHEHNEEREVAGLVEKLAGGASMALVSDAGTPLLADPGFRLVRGCRAAGVPVLSVPGPSAVTAALAVAGLAPYPFTFAGFLPVAGGARRRALAELAPLSHTLVLFLSPHRLAAELAACCEALGGGREAALVTEISKLHERWRGGTLQELADAADELDTRGEHVLVVAAAAPAPVEAPSAERARAALEAALAQGFALAEARREAARALGISRRELYALLERDQR
jgi:16S rRNA (cytidine1402-2'-O)-methyltransferase